MPFTLIPFLLLVIPILEITVFILVGNAIGLWPTLAIVVTTAVAGTMLLRSQGFKALARIQNEIRAGRLPGRELVDGVMIVVAGILLLTPGLVSDTLGLLLFLSPVREAIWRFLKGRVVVAAASQGRQWRRGPAPHKAGPGQPGVVDLSDDDFTRKADPHSPWAEDKPGGSDPSTRTLH